MAVWQFWAILVALLVTFSGASIVSYQIGFDMPELTEIQEGVFLLQKGFGLHRRSTLENPNRFSVDLENPLSITSSLAHQAWDTAIHTKKVVSSNASNVSNASSAPSSRNPATDARGSADVSNITGNTVVNHTTGFASNATVGPGRLATNSTSMNSTNSTVEAGASNSSSIVNAAAPLPTATTANGSADGAHVPDIMGWPTNVALMGCCFTVEDGWELGSFCCLRAWISSKHACGSNVSSSTADVGWNLALCPSSVAEAGEWLGALGPHHADSQEPFREDSHDSSAPLARSSFRHPAYAGDEDPLVPIVHGGGAGA